MIIELEDGRKVDIQDGATPQQIDEVVAQITAPQPQAPQQPPVVPQTGGADSFGRGLVQGGTFNFGDELQGAGAAALAKTIYADQYKDQPFGDLYTQFRDTSRQQDKQAQASHPWLYGGGQLAGTVATGLKIPMPVANAGQYAVGAGLGGASGYGSSESDTTKGQLVDTGLGAAAGLGGAYLGNKIGQVLSSASTSKVMQDAKDYAHTILGKFYQPETALAPVGASAQVANQSPNMVEALRNGATPEEAAILDRAKGFNIRLSRGDVIRTPEQQGLEDMALRGAYGDEAAIAAQNFRKAQGQDIKNAAHEITQRISGAPYMEDQAQAGGALAAKLKTLESADNAGVNSAYDAVAAAGNARIATPFLNKRLGIAANELKDFPLENMPSTRSVLARAQKAFSVPEGGQFTAPADLAKIDNFRKFINRAGESVQLGNNTDKAGVQIIKKHLDAAIDEAVDNNLVYGNPEAIAKLKNAREMARGYFTRWKAGDAVQKIVENDYTPEQVVNLVRGYGQVGGNKQAATLVDNLKGILGDSSQEFAMLKQAQLRQIFGKNMENLMAGDIAKGFSAEEVRKNLSTLFANNKSLADAYFSPTEQETLKGFLDVAYRATNRVDGAVNYSNTTPALIRWAKQFANKFGVVGRLAGAPFELVEQGMAGIKRAAEGQQAIQSFSPQFSNPNNPFTTALRSKVAASTAAVGSISAGRMPATKKPMQVTVHPDDAYNIQKFYK